MLQCLFRCSLSTPLHLAACLLSNTRSRPPPRRLSRQSAMALSLSFSLCALFTLQLHHTHTPLSSLSLPPCLYSSVPLTHAPDCHPRNSSLDLHCISSIPDARVLPGGQVRQSMRLRREEKATQGTELLAIHLQRLYPKIPLPPRTAGPLRPTLSPPLQQLHLTSELDPPRVLLSYRCRISKLDPSRPRQSMVLIHSRRIISIAPEMKSSNIIVKGRPFPFIQIIPA